VAITKISLHSFRNFENKIFNFSNNTTVIIGPNGSGKTTILEAINLTATGKSFKAKVEAEMINYQAQIARVKGKVKDTILEVVLTKGIIQNAGQEKKTARKRLLVNNLAKRLVDFTGNFQTVIFKPQDLDIVTASPSKRRDFLDQVLTQTDKEYRRNLLSYEKGLRRRNKILYKIREYNANREQLIFWNQLLIKNGDYISLKRQNFIDYINQTKQLGNQNTQVVYDKSAISESRLNQYAKQEIYAATTLVGPHRDDMIFKSAEIDLNRFGSRGEQRMAILWLKLAQLSYIVYQTGQKPTLLLDDIFSELDKDHRAIVAKIIKDQQTILTTANPQFIKRLSAVEKIAL